MRAAYRLQLTPEFGFREARSLVPYLRRLGISHLYLSPSFEARCGSTHGYDVVDPTRISRDRGGEQAFRELCESGLDVLLDIVPNHMAASGENALWADPERRSRFFDLDPVSKRHRRFFDIDELAGVRVEVEDVFAHTHELVLSLVAEGLVDGLRIDHVDGLADPAGYLDRLRTEGAGSVWVEKILEGDEELPNWPVEGTTGYEFLNDALGLFIDPGGEQPLTELHAELTGERRPFEKIAAEAKLEQARLTFQPEVDRLCRLWPDGPYPAPAMQKALSALPVYRTYVEPWSQRVNAQDRSVITRADLPEDLRGALLLEAPGCDELVTRYQQTTGAVMAKGVEDTALYRYTRLVALNEVGGNPSRFGLSLTEFHAGNAARAERFPRGLLTTQTHDTKRSADVRARIGVLASIPEEWSARVSRWLDLTEPLRSGGAPDNSERYLIFQTLVGAWPLSAKRLEAYVQKALREAKRNTSWVDPDPAWEENVLRFCRGIYEHDVLLSELQSFVLELVWRARLPVLGQLLLKLTSPGVPDIYQGDELECLSLVDPDNRQAVDWELRQRVLERILSGAAPDSANEKLYVTARTLDLRSRHPSAFEGDYTPESFGEGVCGFRRGDSVMVAVPLREGASKPQPPGWSDLLPELPLGLFERVRPRRP